MDLFLQMSSQLEQGKSCLQCHFFSPDVAAEVTAGPTPPPTPRSHGRSHPRLNPSPSPRSYPRLTPPPTSPRSHDRSHPRLNPSPSPRSHPRLGPSPSPQMSLQKSPQAQLFFLPKCICRNYYRFRNKVRTSQRDRYREQGSLCGGSKLTNSL